MTQTLFKRCLLVLFCLALTLLAMERATDWDLRLADWMFDQARGEFPWRENWFAAVFMHRWMKILFGTLAAALWLVLLLDWGCSRRLLSPRVRSGLSTLALSAIAVPLAISLLKQASPVYCPWDLARYGGHAPYLHPFELAPLHLAPGHCFPAGHAGSALWLAAIAAFWLPERPRTAAWIYGLALLPGLALGWVQQLRGAHFLSHTLWSAWFASLIILLIARCLLPMKPAPAPCQPCP